MRMPSRENKSEGLYTRSQGESVGEGGSAESYRSLKAKVGA